MLITVKRLLSWKQTYLLEYLVMATKMYIWEYLSKIRVYFIAMDTPELTLAIVLTSLATLTSLVVAVWLCTCCYKKRKEKDEYDKLEEVTSYKPISQDERSDVKRLTTHSWEDPSAKSPFLTRKTIK